MNNKIVSIKKTSVIFLAIVLITGTFAVISPLFITGANAQDEPYYGGGMDNSYDDKKSDEMDYSYGYSDYRHDKDKKYDSSGPPVYGMDDRYDKKPVYGMDNSYKPQYTSYDGKDDKRDKIKKDSQVDIKKIKCNNINLNANGGELNETSSFPFLSGIIDEKESNADERSVSSYGSDERSYNDKSYDGHSDKDKDGFAFVCINDNNNIVVGGEEEEEPDLACEECFAANSTLQTAIVDFLVDFNSTIEFLGFEGEVLVIGPGTDTIEQLCALIENSAKNSAIPLSNLFIDFVISTMLGIEDFTAPESGIDALIECLLEAGIIVEREIPSPPLIEICDDGIDNDGDDLIDCEDPDCIGGPLCEPEPQ